MMFENDGEYDKILVDIIFDVWCDDKGKDKSKYNHLSQDFLDDMWDFAWKLTYDHPRKGKKVREFLTKNKELKEERGKHEYFAAKCLLKTLCYLLDRIDKKERYGRYY